METNLNCWIISRDRRFLVAIPEVSGQPKYSPHAYDAARIEDANDARAVADRIGGNIHRFDPLTGEVV